MIAKSSTLPANWSAQVRIRTLTEADLPALEWDGEFTHFRRLYADIYRTTLQGKALMWGAELPGAGLVGQLFVQFISGRSELADGNSRAYIYGFRVKLSFRGHGIGTRLLQMAEADLAQRGFHWVTLNVGRDNPDARRLYERLGYRVVANEPGRWSYQDEQGNLREVNEPAWRMEKPLYRTHSG